MSESLPNHITLQPAETNDREFLCQVYISTRLEELAVTGWPAEVIDQFLRSQFDLQDQHYRKYYPNARFDIIRIHDQPAGRLYVDRWENEIRIIDIALLPAYRRLGVGSVLLRDIIRQASEQNLKVSIHVEQNNPAMSLYVRLGFQPIQQHGIYFLMERPAGDAP